MSLLKTLFGLEPCAVCGSPCAPGDILCSQLCLGEYFTGKHVIVQTINDDDITCTITEG